MDGQNLCSICVLPLLWRPFIKEVLADCVLLYFIIVVCKSAPDHYSLRLKGTFGQMAFVQSGVSRVTVVCDRCGPSLMSCPWDFLS